MDRIDGSFHIEEMVGEGQFSRVFKARYLTTSYLYAIKIIPVERLDKHYIMNELRIGSILDHPKIVKVDFCLQLGPYFCLAMEYVKGITLNRIISQRIIEEKEAKLFIIEIIDALIYLHSHGIVHRDIKASNIMITKFGIKLIDLGTISFSVDPEEENFLAGLTFGSNEPVENEEKSTTSKLGSRCSETVIQSRSPFKNSTKSIEESKKVKKSTSTKQVIPIKNESKLMAKFAGKCKSSKSSSQNKPSEIDPIDDIYDYLRKAPFKEWRWRSRTGKFVRYDSSDTHFLARKHTRGNTTSYRCSIPKVETRKVMKKNSTISSSKNKLKTLTTKEIDPQRIKESITHLENSDPLQTSRFRCGTMIYLAPEGKIPFVSTKLDIWALACLIYRMVTGKELNDTEDMQYLSDKTLQNDFSFLEDKKLSEDLKDLLKNMLKHNPKERYNIRQVLESKWLNDSKENRFKYAYCPSCDTYLKNFQVDSYYILCHLCQEYKEASILYTGRNDWLFYRKKTKKMTNDELVLSVLDNWGFKGILESRFISLLNLCRNSYEPAYRFGNIMSGTELSVIYTERKQIRAYFKTARETCEFLPALAVFLLSPLHFFFNERIFFSRLSISRLEFILNSFLLSALTPERKSRRGFKYNLRFYERSGVTKIVIKKTKGAIEDLNFIFKTCLSVVRKIEPMDGLEVPCGSHYDFALKMVYKDDKFIEQRKM